MREVTTHFLEYVEAKRHLWNTHFIDKARSIKDDVIGHYERLDKLLFVALALEPSGLKTFGQDVRFGSDPIPNVRVVPRSGIDRLSVMISDPNSGLRRVWSKPTEIPTKGAVFNFVEFFEWNRYGFVAYPYYRTRIMKLGKLTEHIGMDCLMEVKDAGVCVER
jgi:hypothetical protein